MFLQRDKGAQDGIVWSFPSGKVEKDEASFDAVIREVKEETGLKVIPECMLGKNQISPDLCLTYWLCKRVGGELKPESNGATSNVAFRPVSEIEDLIAPRKLHHVIAEYIGTLPRREQTKSRTPNPAPRS